MRSSSERSTGKSISAQSSWGRKAARRSPSRRTWPRSASSSRARVTSVPPASGRTACSQAGCWLSSASTACTLSSREIRVRSAARSRRPYMALALVASAS